MHLRSLALQHFRNYTQWSFQFPRTPVVFIGENAKGKTNILEAISLLSTGDSFRAQHIEEMVKWGQEVGRVAGLIEEKPEHDEPLRLEVVLSTGQVQGARAQKRKFLVDDVSRRKKDFAGRLLTVMFRPEDMDLITGSPSLRRNFLNSALCQVDKDYRFSLDTYEKTLKRRNALLDVLREGNTTRAAFAFWDQALIKHGNIITDRRRDFVAFLNRQAQFDGHTKNGDQLEIVYDSSTISEERLHHYAVQEVEAGYTLVGPHKDDFNVVVRRAGADRELSTYGSRGEQRMAVLWLKIGEIAHIEEIMHQRPVLLLDDIFSELDSRHQETVSDLINKQQTIMTATENILWPNIEAEIVQL